MDTPSKTELDLIAEANPGELFDGSEPEDRPQRQRVASGKQVFLNSKRCQAKKKRKRRRKNKATKKGRS